MLRSFDAPPPAVIQDNDAFRERVTSAASGLLALLGIDADPLRSREHILLASLFDKSWRDGVSLQLADLIRGIQSPPFDKVGVLDLETFFPKADRFSLAMSINNLLASPGFAGWLEGEPLNIGRLLYTDQGKPRLSIISIAHLSDAERMFFVTILLNEVVAWMRSQSGTSSLRAILYMDEVFGYFPPTANPPSKLPMLTLLKQARAFGLGVVLATQNPVDLDYKGLSNAGTWFLGRLQTERDKARVLEGLEGASAAAGRSFDRAGMEQTLAGLGRRVFLMNNVHDDEPAIFQTRWTLSYLRGPLTRQQIQSLMASRKAAAGPAAAVVTARSLPAYVAARPRCRGSSVGRSAGRIQPAGVTTAGCTAGRQGVLPGGPEAPAARGSCTGRACWERPACTTSTPRAARTSGRASPCGPCCGAAKPATSGRPRNRWPNAEPELQAQPDADAAFSALPPELARGKSYASWTKAFKDYLYRERALTLRFCPDLKLFSQPDESEADFRIRLQTAAREQRDLEVEKLKKRYEPKFATLADQKRRAEQRVDREKSQYRQHQMQTAISFGTSILGALFGRKLASTTNVTRAASAMKGVGRSLEQRSDIGRAEESTEQIEEKISKLEAEFQEETAQIEHKSAADQLPVEEVSVQPRKTDIAIGTVCLLWTPWHVGVDGISERGF